MDPAWLESLLSGVDELARRRLRAYVAGILAENQQVNLTGARGEEEFWARHVADSLELAALLRERGAGTLLDVGSGGGLPGVPLACALPGVRVTLLDATRKKLDAVMRVCAAAGIENVSARWGRAEQLGQDAELRELFDAVTARAVAALPVLLELSAGFVRVGGAVWLFKSARAADEEVAAARSAAAACGLAAGRRHEYDLPAGHGRMVLLEYRKARALRGDLPRDGSLIARRPLRP